MSPEKNLKIVETDNVLVGTTKTSSTQRASTLEKS